MNEVEANQQLKELAAQHGNARLDAQDYRRKRRLILAKFSASDCSAMDETIEWHDLKPRGDDTAELKVPDRGEDTAEIEVIKSGRYYKIIAVSVVSLLVVVYVVWRAV